MNMNLADPELELIDPTPNVYTLFVHFDKLFFWTKLANRAVVRWSKRMYSCAGTCSYEGRGGLCDIALSEPLLKLRPRKDMIETLLHEMIHAFLFVTNRDQDRDGHGPNFKAHMHRINQFAGLNISIYHSFHDEVELYQTHWWRCNGRCQTKKPYFGIVKRTVNKPPGPKDYWWEKHKQYCGGTFVKFKEPEKKSSKKTVPKTMGDITNFISVKGVDKPVSKPKSVIQPGTRVKVVRKSNGMNTVIIAEDNNTKCSLNSPKTVPLFSGVGKTIDNKVQSSKLVDVHEQVRNVWVNKQISSINDVQKKEPSYSTAGLVSNSNKHKIDSKPGNSPPTKVKRIDEYFKTTATSILKDVYGEDFKLTQPKTSNKLIAVKCNEANVVACPVCSIKVESNVINSHLDECLNKDVIAQLSKNSDETGSHTVSSRKSSQQLEKINTKPIGALDTPVLPFNSDIGNCNDYLSTSPLDFTPTNVEAKSAPVLNNSFNSVDKHVKLSSSRSIDLTSTDAAARPSPLNKKSHNHLSQRSVEDNLSTRIIDLTYINAAPKSSPKRKQSLSNTNNPSTKLNNNYNKNVSFEPSDVEKVKLLVKKVNFDRELKKVEKLIMPKAEKVKDVDVGYLPSFLDDMAKDIKIPAIKIEPGTSKDKVSALTGQNCPCCGNSVDKPIEQHLDECMAFFINSKEPEEGSSMSFANETIILDDSDDIFDETMTMNDTGTKTPCPCCLKMIEENDMNDHLDTCLN